MLTPTRKGRLVDEHNLSQPSRVVADFDINLSAVLTMYNMLENIARSKNSPNAFNDPQEPGQRRRGR